MSLSSVKHGSRKLLIRREPEGQRVLTSVGWKSYTALSPKSNCQQGCVSLQRHQGRICRVAFSAFQSPPISSQPLPLSSESAVQRPSVLPQSHLPLTPDSKVSLLLRARPCEQTGCVCVRACTHMGKEGGIILLTTQGKRQVPRGSKAPRQEARRRLSLWAFGLEPSFRDLLSIQFRLVFHSFLAVLRRLQDLSSQPGIEPTPSVVKAES